MSARLSNNHVAFKFLTIVVLMDRFSSYYINDKSVYLDPFKRSKALSFASKKALP